MLTENIARTEFCFKHTFWPYTHQYDDNSLVTLTKHLLKSDYLDKFA